ncbi:unnamed protein product [Caenorhabditis angaria]|uniref:Tetratricopeptide repeat protein 36 n=1 Tax=Caenorhabditis angaria TaxID=860376 RepID=A0A9P1MZ26_9PELO|nr:unnamed protein product [Caenorhabditis angaria]
MSTEHDRAVLNQILNPLMPTTETSSNNSTQFENDQIDHCGYEESVGIEKEAVILAESGKVPEAIEKFGEAISKCPINPSAFNNRAQAYRLSGKIEEAISDLNEALKLSNPKSKTTCNAYVQRASIFRLKGDDDKAREDFQKAADLGSSFAKMQLIALNPYAAMCNKMLAEVFEKVKTGQ